MKISIAGGSGFIGDPLVRRLTRFGEVVVLTRDPSHVRHGRGVEWHPPSLGEWVTEVGTSDVVVNLAGENIGARRWSADRKRKLVSSRLESTSAIVAALKQSPGMPRALINASAVGFYGDRGDASVDELSSAGTGFLAELCEKWEAAAREAESVARVVVLRFGVVLDKSGGALAKMLLPFRLGAGGPIGSGAQWMSWIDRDDVVRAIEWSVENHAARGVYNATSPEPVRNREFAHALGHALHRPSFMPMPGFALRLAFGDMADETILGGQRVLPSRLESEGFAFAEPKLAGSLARILGR
jgi:uncharacterized protein